MAFAAQGRATMEVETRVKLAASPATPAGLLAGLAADDAVTVRAAVALNPSLPLASQQQLAADADGRVRLLLARKLANALPGLSGPSQAEIRDRTLAILSGLVRDETIRIRQVIAAALAALPDVPREAVIALAQDGAIPVSEPVLRLSPLLSAEDLLGLLADPPHSLTAAAIACRANLPEAVADAIAATADSPAIRALLANPSAAIRESTLDSLIARAPAEPDWHAPLVHRPCLPDHAARALSEIVAAHLLGELAARPGLPAALIASIRQRLDGAAAAARPVAAQTDGHLVAEARRLDERGVLDEAQMLAALRAGEHSRACVLLAVAAAVPLSVVQRAASLRSAKGLASLVWKAGFSARAAAPVQTAIGKIAPSALLAATPSGAFPLTPDEMRWQLDFLSGNGR